MGAGQVGSVGWVDVELLIDGLPKEPYLVAQSEFESISSKLKGAGFQVFGVDIQDVGPAIEEDLLVDLSAELGFSMLGAGSWAAFNDRLWDLLTAEEKTPVAIFIRNSDKIRDANLHTFVRCVHNLVSMTESVGLSDAVADRQVAYFFTGEW